MEGGLTNIVPALCAFLSISPIQEILSGWVDVCPTSPKSSFVFTRPTQSGFQLFSVEHEFLPSRNTRFWPSSESKVRLRKERTRKQREQLEASDVCFFFVQDVSLSLSHRDKRLTINQVPVPLSSIFSLTLHPAPFFPPSNSNSLPSPKPFLSAETKTKSNGFNCSR